MQNEKSQYVDESNNNGLYQKKKLFRTNGPLWAWNDTSSQLWIGSKNFFKILRLLRMIFACDCLPSSSQKKLSYLPWSRKYPNFKTTYHIEPKKFFELKSSRTYISYLLQQLSWYDNPLLILGGTDVLIWHFTILLT